MNFLKLYRLKHVEAFLLYNENRKRPEVRGVTICYLHCGGYLYSRYT